MALKCNISHRLTKTSKSGAVELFEMKLEQFRKRMGNVNLCHSASCDLLHRHGSVRLPFQSVLSVERTEILADNSGLRSLTFAAVLRIHNKFNLLNPTGHVMHQQFNIQQLYALPTLHLCVLHLSENKQRLVPLT